jgi:prolyl-tRNA synthetase
MEIGPKDVAKGSVAFARRDIPGRAGKSFVSQNQILEQTQNLLDTIQSSMYERALTFRQENTYHPKDYNELTEAVQQGWALSWWCGSAECEAQVKDDTKATTRCIPLEQEGGQGPCIVCGKPSHQKVIFARAY